MRTACSVAETRAEEIVRNARDLLAKEGAISMRRLADRLGIKAPSLYKHFPDKGAIETALIAEALRDIARAMSSHESLSAVLSSYRTWALGNPHLYALATQTVLDRDRLPPGVEAQAAEPILTVVHGDPDRARALWAAAHGLVSLELAQRFPAHADVAAAWRALSTAFQRADGP
jgi:AcrR family transcriptional regulator